MSGITPVHSARHRSGGTSVLVALVLALVPPLPRRWQSFGVPRASIFSWLLRGPSK